MDRTKHIGGSDISDIFNIPPYGCARRLFYEKAAIEPDYAVRPSGAMLRGKKLEALVAEEFAERTGRKIRRCKPAKGAHPWEVGNLDFEQVGATGKGPGALECKTAGEKRFRQFLQEGISTDYRLQNNWYMGLKKYEWGSFAILEPSLWRFDWFDVEFDREAFTMSREAAARWWRNFKQGIMPERLPASDDRCQECPWRYTCQGVYMLETVDNDAPAETIPGINDLGRQLIQIKAVVAEAKAAEDAIAAQIKQKLGNVANAAAPDVRITYKTSRPKRPDAERLKQKYPDVYADVVRESTQRTLIVRPTKQAKGE